MIIDAHHHLWRLSRGDYAFPLPQDPVLYRDFMPEVLGPLLATAGVDRTVLVQATDTVEETGFLLDVAAATPWVAGVVGWWDPRPKGVLDRLAVLPHAERLVGVRPMLQRYDDVSWIVEPSALEQLSAISSMGWVFDALIDGRQIGAIANLCERLPELKVVIDHMGKPWRHPELFDEWLAGMQQLATAPKCWVKISGFPFASPDRNISGSLPRLLAILTDLFGPDRLVWGSDWPVVEREGGYMKALATISDQIPTSERDALFGGSAATLYRLAVQ